MNNDSNTSISNFVWGTYGKIPHQSEKPVPDKIQVEIPSPDGNKFITVKILTKEDEFGIKKTFKEKLSNLLRGPTSYPIRVVGYEVVPIKMTDKQGNDIPLDDKINKEIIKKCENLLNTTINTVIKEKKLDNQTFEE